MSDVAGQHIGGVTGPGRGESLALVNPARGEAFATVSQSSTQDVTLACTAAADAFAEWSRRTAGERARILLRLADLIESDGPELTRLEVEETGKPTAVFADGELPFAADNLRFFAGSARSLDGTGAGVLSQGYTSMLVRRPIGVVGSIAPWNFPFIMAIWKMGPALAAGNTLVLKPAPGTPRSTLRLAELAGQAAQLGPVKPSWQRQRPSRSESISSSAARPPASSSLTPTSMQWPGRSRWAPPTTPARTAQPRPVSTSSARASPRPPRPWRRAWDPSGGATPSIPPPTSGPSSHRLTVSGSMVL